MLRLLPEAESSSHLDSQRAVSLALQNCGLLPSRGYSPRLWARTNSPTDLMVTKPNGLVLVRRDLRGLLYVRSKHSNARARRAPNGPTKFKDRGPGFSAQKDLNQSRSRSPFSIFEINILQLIERQSSNISVPNMIMRLLYI